MLEKAAREQELTDDSDEEGIYLLLLLFNSLPKSDLVLIISNSSEEAEDEYIKKDKDTEATCNRKTAHEGTCSTGNLS